MRALNAPADPPSSLPAPPALQPPALEPPGQPSRRVLDRLWIAASSPQLTIALAVLLAFTVAIAAVLPQLPAGAEPLAADRWLSATAARFGRFGPLFSSTGLFSILTGPWTVTLLALSAAHLALRLANQARRLGSTRAGIPAAPQGLPFELVHLPLPIDAIEARMATLVAAEKPGAVFVAEPSAPRPRVDGYTERRSWAAVGPLLTYLGPLLLALGLFWNTLAGWRVTEVTLIPGRTVQPGQAGGLALSLVDAGGGEGDRLAVLSLARGSETRYAWLGHARPAMWGPVWVAQRGSGPALAVRASAAGNALPVQSLEEGGAPVDSLHLRFGENESEQAFTIPERNLAFRIVSYESLADRGIDRPVFLVEGYKGNDPAPALNELVEDGGTIDWQGVALSLQREAYVVVDLAAMPGLPLLILGGLVLLAGVAITSWGGLTRTWLNAAVERDGTLVAVRAAAPARGQDEVARVAASLAAQTGANPLTSARPGAVLKYVAYTVAGALLLFGIGALSLRGTQPLAIPAQAWILIPHLTLAILSVAALLVGAGQSAWFALRGDRLRDMSDPMLRGPAHGLRGRPGDPGRGVSLAAFPLLTAALVLGSIWGLLVSASPFWPAAGEMWLLAAWLLAAAYFHATSGWRPARIPPWLAPALLIAALTAGIAACLVAPSVMIL